MSKTWKDKDFRYENSASHANSRAFARRQAARAKAARQAMPAEPQDPVIEIGKLQNFWRTGKIRA